MGLQGRVNRRLSREGTVTTQQLTFTECHIHVMHTVLIT